MKTYETFQLFWNEHSQVKPNTHGFHSWILTKYMHINDTDYAGQVSGRTDQLGFQPLWLTFADPFSQSLSQVLIKNVDDSLLARYLHHARNEYVTQLKSRFGSFTPDELHAFAEYDTWESFYTSWLEREGVSMLHHHIPLLFDHTPAVEHWTRKQTGLDVLPYQRLLITTFFAPKNQFFNFFIKNVPDHELERIQSLHLSRVELNSTSLYASAARV